MNLNSGYFPPHNYRRKYTAGSHSLSFNHQPSIMQSARSSIESTNGNETFLPTISTVINRTDSYKPYRQNDFANNHLFIAKRKLARVFLGQPTRNLQATSDLIHLFDRQEPKRKNKNLTKHKEETLSQEQDAHLSVVNLIIKPPPPSIQTRDPLSSILRNRRPQTNNLPSKPLRGSIDSTTKHNLLSGSLPGFTDNNDLDEIIDNEEISNTFDSSLLCVKSIIPSVGPQHPNSHLLQHR